MQRRSSFLRSASVLLTPVAVALISCAAVPGAALAQAPAPSPLADPVAAIAPEPRPASSIAQRPQPARRSGVDGGLVAAIVVFDVGWLFGILTAVLDVLSMDCGPPSASVASGSVSCNSWPLALIPLGGGIASGFASIGTPRGYDLWGYATGIPSLALQGIGLVMLFVALASRTHGDVTASAVALVPAAPGADVGASLLLRL